jgi:hypothetical protein
MRYDLGKKLDINFDIMVGKLYIKNDIGAYARHNFSNRAGLVAVYFTVC